MAPSFQIALFVCLASLLSVAESCEEKKKPCCPVCPPGWTQYGTRCFILHVRAKPWDQAERDCIAIGGNLASIHSAKEQNFLREHMARVGYGFRLTWIGLHDGPKEGVYFWSDGTRFDYQAWRAGQPNNLRNEDCVAMNFGGNFWDDQRCVLSRSYVCAKDLPCCDDNCNKKW